MSKHLSQTLSGLDGGSEMGTLCLEQAAHTTT